MGWTSLCSVVSFGRWPHSARTNPTSPSRPSSTEGVGFEPTRPFRVNALAGRRLKPLGHPSKLSSPTPFSRVRPSNCPARARTWTLLIQSQTCCQLHHGASNRTIINLGLGCTQLETRAVPAEKEPPVGLEPTTPSLRMTCSTTELRWRPKWSRGESNP